MKPNQKLTRVFDALIIVSVAIFLVGNIFRILHWPNGKEASMISLGILVLLTGVKHYQKPEKNYLDLIGLLIILLLISIQLNKLTHSTKMIGLFGLLWLTLIIWVVSYIISVIRKKSIFQMTTSNIILLIGIGCLAGEIFMRFAYFGAYTVLFFHVSILLILAGLVMRFSKQKPDVWKNN